MKRAHRIVTTAATLAVASFATPHAALAHFALVAPESRSATSDTFGDPQKSAPCGQADPGTPEQPNGVVTTLKEGSMFTVTIDELVTHPGHYRVALAQDQSSLPPDPPVTAGSTACGSTTIDANPTLPVLADGLFVHTAAFTSPQSAQVQLPAGMTCTHCTLQVIEFMSNHALNNPGGCFYHHCATVDITAAGPAPDAGGGGGGPGGDAGTTTGPGSHGGCNTHGGSSPSILVFLAGVRVFGRRRRSSVRRNVTQH